MTLLAEESVKIYWRRKHTVAVLLAKKIGGAYADPKEGEKLSIRKGNMKRGKNVH
jgi:hypothetical protein